MTVETYRTADGDTVTAIRCRPIERPGPGHDLPPWEQLIGHEAQRLAVDISEELAAANAGRPVHVEIVTDIGRADYEVTSSQHSDAEGFRFNVRRRT